MSESHSISELIQILAVMSQFLLKGHKILNFLLHFFLKISETVESSFLERKQVLTNSKKLSSCFLTVFRPSQ